MTYLYYVLLLVGGTILLCVCLRLLPAVMFEEYSVKPFLCTVESVTLFPV